MTATAVAPTTATPVTGTARRRLARVACVAGAGVLNAALFAAGRLADVDFTITDPGPNGAAHTFVATEIALISVIFGLLGWAALAVLERFTTHAARWWTIAATVVVALSMVPIGLEIASTGTRVMLAVIHAAVAVALIPMLRRR